MWLRDGISSKWNLPETHKAKKIRHVSVLMVVAGVGFALRSETTSIFGWIVKQDGDPNTSTTEVVWLRDEISSKWNLPESHKAKKNKTRKCLNGGSGSGIRTTRPSGYEPDERPDCSSPRYTTNLL